MKRHVSAPSWILPRQEIQTPPVCHATCRAARSKVSEDLGGLADGPTAQGRSLVAGTAVNVTCFSWAPNPDAADAVGGCLLFSEFPEIWLRRIKHSRQSLVCASPRMLILFSPASPVLVAGAKQAWRRLASLPRSSPPPLKYECHDP